MFIRMVTMALLALVLVDEAHARLLFTREIRGLNYEFRLYEQGSGDVDLTANGPVFINAVDELYMKELSLELADLNSAWTSEKEYWDWLNDTVEEEEEMCRKERALCVQVLQEGKAVAWASYEEDQIEKEEDQIEKSEVYIRQMMVHPTIQRSGMGAILLDEVIPVLHPNYTRIYLITRALNKKARRFYEKNGFQRSSYISEGYDQEKYIGYERKTQ